jgi:pimeloyl-ACP methyl ester carboxylesterase
MELIPQIGAKKRLAATMAGSKTRRQSASRKSGSARNQAAASSRPAQDSKHLVSGRWLISAALTTIAAAALCTWIVLCLLFWQGNWQLLYHPVAAITLTPSAAGLQFEPVAFAVTDEGIPRLKGWWIPAAPDAVQNRYTVLFFHGPNGNLSNSIDSLARLNAVGVNVLAFDYRGYGQSEYARPSETHWRQDAESAIQYLIGTRHINAGSIVLDGEGLGANLALEVAAAHPELAGVVVESPAVSPMDAVFEDARAKMVPARLLVRDRFDLAAVAKGSRIPVLWFEWNARNGRTGFNEEPAIYKEITSQKALVWLNPQFNGTKDFEDALSRFLDELPRD